MGLFGKAQKSQRRDFWNEKDPKRAAISFVAAFVTAKKRRNTLCLLFCMNSNSKKRDEEEEEEGYMTAKESACL